MSNKLKCSLIDMQYCLSHVNHALPRGD